MEGSIRQRGTSSWELRVYAGRDTVTGRKRWISRTVRGSKREAQRELRALAATVDHGLAAKTSATVGDLLERWLEHAEPDLSPTTERVIRGYLDRILLPGIGHVPVASLRSADLDSFYRSLRQSGGKDGRALAPATVRKVHGILRRALSQGVRWGWLGTNPAPSASPPRVPVKELTPPSPAEVRRLLELANETRPDMATFVLLAASTGARRSELVALRWTSVDFAKRELRVSRGIVRGRHGLVEKDTKTHSSRRVSLDPTTAEALRTHRVRAEHAAAECETVLQDDAFIFSNDPDGSRPWQPESVSRMFNRLCREAGVNGQSEVPARGQEKSPPLGVFMTSAFSLLLSLSRLAS